MNPPEVDLPEDVQKGQTSGCIAAARRKLLHELGIIVPTEEQSDEITWKWHFVTRLHYWAADTVTPPSCV